MENIKISGNLKIPTVVFDAEKGILELSGRSTPENGEEVYEPLIDWVKEYVKNPRRKTTVNVNFEYFNSTSSKFIVRLLDHLKEIEKAGFELEINWFYEDEDIMEYGRDFEEILELKFNYIYVDED